MRQVFINFVFLWTVISTVPIVGKKWKNKKTAKTQRKKLKIRKVPSKPQVISKTRYKLNNQIFQKSTFLFPCLRVQVPARSALAAPVSPPHLSLEHLRTCFAESGRRSADKVKMRSTSHACAVAQSWPYVSVHAGYFSCVNKLVSKYAAN